MKEENVIEKDMTPRLIGETYMKYATETSHQRYTYGLYECQYCGTQWECRTTTINRGYTKSCGCLQKRVSRTHGLHNHRMYFTWNGMLARCNNLNSKRYKDYGGRGIKVCEEWLDIKNFVDWVDNKSNWEEGLTLDRIDNDKGYSPDNCRWADKTTQVVNQRMKSNNTSKVLGVSWKSRDKRWGAQISHMGKKVWLGQFISIEDAIEARNSYILVNKLPNPLSVLITK